MTKERLKELIDGMDVYVAVSEIEKQIGMPPTTLQKFLSGKRGLPKKWHKVIEAYFGSSDKTTPQSIITVKPPTEIEAKKEVTPDRKPFMSDAIKKKLGIN